MNNWEEKRIFELGKVVTGKTPSKTEETYWDGNELFVSPKDMKRDSFYINDTKSKISSLALQKFKSQIIPRNSVMYTSLSFGFGKIGIASKDLITNQQINSIIVNNENYFKFIYYLLRVNTPYIFSYNSGIDTPFVPKSVFEKIKLLVPPLQVQERIAYVLSSYDELIENNNRRIKLLEKASQDLYKEWFVRFRFPGYRETKFKNGIPEGWMIEKLGAVVNITSSKRVYLSDYVSEGVPFYRSKEIIQLSNGKVISDTLYISNEKYNEIKNKYGVPKKNDILLTSVGTIGIPMLVSNNNSFYFKDGNLTWIQSSLKERIAIYLYLWIKSEGGYQQLLSSTIGTSQSALTIEKLKNIKILKPSEDIILKFSSLASNFIEEINNLQTQNINLIKQRDLLLPRLMSGKLRV